ncbi:SNF2 helicase with zinc finger RING-type domain [Fadolivirus algeromassiliense]|jgi:superfamily II DNA or RNA helicase|uniref:SNF2 helicase with zinc finger RING-type domain n=1 Tax=Fadolivirus FV1/VV64 TaxID=3070911 RepID=A0A7D3R136_9VIRU|nr:SNF2 helicase with zinc finger RING-type domain [Fadolivirus algeromassiliense]QKF94161.1 SNF2 helicase with zinc finger RING-type domain [Fadolivirus FV1/VV64]
MVYNDLNETSERISQPSGLTIQLMEHQKSCVYAMRKMEDDGKLLANNIKQYGDETDFSIETSMGILADKVGSGKSLMIVSLIETCKVPNKRDIYLVGSKFIAIKSTASSNPISTNLLLIPHKLMNQWIEFFKFAPNLKIDTYKDVEDETRINTVDDLKDLDVLIVACSKSTSFFKKFQNTKWSRVIVDEADTIKLASISTFNANFIWLVTATPKSLRYSTKIYFTKIFKNITPWVFDYLIVKNNLEFIEKSIILPTPLRIIINCLTPKELSIIKNFIPKNILSMINAGNSDEAIRALNCNVDTNDNILKVITNNLVEAINNKKLELDCEQKKIYHNQKNKQDQEEKIKKIKRCIERLETRYNSIKDKIYNLNDSMCPICMDEFTKPTIVNCCQNVYCFDCITMASSNNGLCPACKAKVFKENLHIISDKENTKQNKPKDIKEKLDMLLEVLEANPEGKFLVFANFSQTFDKIQVKLDDLNITYKVLKGTTGLVQKTIDDFSNGNIRVIMLNAKFFGAGMNLQMATHVVLYHRFDADLEEQVIGRAQRLGRKDPLNVIYLIHDNETEAFTNKDKFEEMDYDKWLEQDNDNEENNIEDSKIENVSQLLIEQEHQDDTIDHIDNEDEIEVKPKSKQIKSNIRKGKNKKSAVI